MHLFIYWLSSNKFIAKLTVLLNIFFIFIQSIKTVGHFDQSNFYLTGPIQNLSGMPGGLARFGNSDNMWIVNIFIRIIGLN